MYSNCELRSFFLGETVLDNFSKYFPYFRDTQHNTRVLSVSLPFSYIWRTTHLNDTAREWFHYKKRKSTAFHIRVIMLFFSRKLYKNNLTSEISVSRALPYSVFSFNTLNAHSENQLYIYLYIKRFAVTNLKQKKKTYFSFFYSRTPRVFEII